VRCDAGAETGRGGGDAASGDPVRVGDDDDTVGGGCALFGRRNGGSPRGDATGDGDGGCCMASSSTTTSVIVVVDIAVRRAVRRARIVYVLWCITVTSGVSTRASGDGMDWRARAVFL